MTGGKSPIGYLKAYLTNLYLSADSEKVQEAIEEGVDKFFPCFNHTLAQGAPVFLDQREHPEFYAPGHAAW